MTQIQSLICQVIVFLIETRAEKVVDLTFNIYGIDVNSTVFFFASNGIFISVGQDSIGKFFIILVAYILAFSVNCCIQDWLLLPLFDRSVVPKRYDTGLAKTAHYFFDIREMLQVEKV